MKSRQGFVSNSSSSSFIIFGVINPPNMPSYGDSEKMAEFQKRFGHLYLGNQQYACGFVIDDQTPVTLQKLVDAANKMAPELGVESSDFQLLFGERPA